MVPDSSFNLSYASLTSREARQAILDSRLSNPELYAELMAAHPPAPLPNSAEEEPGLDQVEEEESPDVSALELEQAIMQSNSTADVAAFLEAQNHSGDLDNPHPSGEDTAASQDCSQPGGTPQAATAITEVQRSWCSRKKPVRFTSGK